MRAPSVIAVFLDLLVPPRCQVCRARPQHPLCDPCRASFEPITAPVCVRCGVPLRGSSDLVFTCISCRRHRRPYAAARSYGFYDGQLREAVHALKFRRRRALAEPLGALMAAAVEREETFRRPDVVVPVPLHWRRRWTRTYNQAELLAAAVARRLGVRLDARSLARVRGGAAQAGLKEAERRQNVRGAFRADPGVRGKRVLLVDDVMTTGSTIEECARALRRAGARSVHVLTLARSVLR